MSGREKLHPNCGDREKKLETLLVSAVNHIEANAEGRVLINMIMKEVFVKNPTIKNNER